MSRKAHNKHITCWLGDDDIAAGTLSSKREDEKNWTSSDPRVIVQKPYDTCATVSCLTSFINSWSKLFCLWQAPLIALSIWFKSLPTVCCWLHFSLIQPQCLQVLCFTDATERSSTVEGEELDVLEKCFCALELRICDEMRGNRSKSERLKLCTAPPDAHKHNLSCCTPPTSAQLIWCGAGKLLNRLKCKRKTDAQGKCHYESITVTTEIILRGNISYKHCLLPFITQRVSD